jgi:DNA-binding NarL/FixJ family response regulator
MMSVRIVIADDHDIVRCGIRTLVEGRPDWKIIGEATNGREAVNMAQRLHPDVCIFDHTMPDMNGVEATRQTLQSHACTNVLMLTMHESEQLIREILEAGARGYVLKSDAGRDMMSAIESLSLGKLFFTSTVSSLVLGEFLRSTHQKGTGTNAFLSSRQREIVQLLAEGKSNKDVANILGISIKTAETHRHHIMQKLQCTSVVDLVHYAIRNHMVAP